MCQGRSTQSVTADAWRHHRTHRARMGVYVVLAFTTGCLCSMLTLRG